MLRACLKPLPVVAQSLRQRAVAAPNIAFPRGSVQPMSVTSMRAFAAGAKPKVEDGTLEGRYATALYMATGDRLDKVYDDLVNLRSMIASSADLKLMVETPGIDPDRKVDAIQAVCGAAGSDPAVVNFLKVLVENKRLKLLPRMIDLYEVFYRAEKGLVPCTVTSASPLSSSQMSEVESAMQKRAGAGATLIMDFNTNPAILGGLVVKMGEAIYDNSVSTRLERLQTQLLAPLS
mmetsp:Transcript_26805/g.41663  ORF Transcript_26805/g.41663 Transcript_26805/m.41663 type:complete len:234 (+) Transcript_26805:66-767(+)|eukprot:CAMPEP_0169138246 /NCGR_PEP_ID=MMETSP1015-20121227/42098_1 /TAXON_ID=342587 /ORGANISM="Karlodinium micrum, Strain CCMP2283" /LENGTH=233 /DNA_ID=CAMNT_0009203401 /DNA_START=62 /DNA_END=763 /DNA_ORIENTATION=+